MAINEFVRATGGGRGKYPDESECQSNDPIEVLSLNCFHQYQWSSSVREMAFGRVSFTCKSEEAVEPKFYLKIPSSTDPYILVHFVENVWNIPRPKLVIGITGGATEFPITEDMERILNELMRLASENNAWIITGGTSAGIMKYIGHV